MSKDSKASGIYNLGLFKYFEGFFFSKFALTRKFFEGIFRRILKTFTKYKYEDSLINSLRRPSEGIIKRYSKLLRIMKRQNVCMALKDLQRV